MLLSIAVDFVAFDVGVAIVLLAAATCCSEDVDEAVLIMLGMCVCVGDADDADDADAGDVDDADDIVVMFRAVVTILLHINIIICAVLLGGCGCGGGGVSPADTRCFGKTAHCKQASCPNRPEQCPSPWPCHSGRPKRPYKKQGLHLKGTLVTKKGHPHFPTSLVDDMCV